jgi:hypothetical protein
LLLSQVDNRKLVIRSRYDKAAKINQAAMGKLKPETAETIWDLQKQLLEII